MRLAATFSRRRFISLAAAAAASRCWGNDSAAGRALRFVIGPGFGSAPAENIEAVLRSAAESIWQHCPNTRWEVPGFDIYRSKGCPITLNDHRPDGRIAIGLDTGDLYWAQYAYQFAHEFGHALAGHSNDWRALDICSPRPNHWLEESICETASLFALRAMGASWQTHPPYPNWASFAPALTTYAQERLEQSRKVLAADADFPAWFRANEASMRENATIREKNNVVAQRLLRLFEEAPAGWESITFFNRVKSHPAQSLAARLEDWRASSPEALRAFIDRVTALFGPRPH